MKSQPFTVIEYHPPNAAPPNQTVRQAVTAWLTKELHK